MSRHLTGAEAQPWWWLGGVRGWVEGGGAVVVVGGQCCAVVSVLPKRYAEWDPELERNAGRNDFDSIAPKVSALTPL